MLFTSILLAACLATLSWAQKGERYRALFPKQNNDFPGNQAITDELVSIVGDRNLIYQSQSSTLGTMYWYAPLSDANKDKFAPKIYWRFKSLLWPADPAPKPPAKPATRSMRFKRAINSQNPASKALKVVSQSDNTDPDKLQSYDYDDSAGQDSRIYIVDSGLAPNLPEFADTEVDWLFGGPFPEEKKDDSDEGDANIVNSGVHGTSMASVALGKTFGVAKKAKLTVVRVDIQESHTLPADLGGETRSSLAPFGWLDGLAQTYDAIKTGKQNGKAVVTMSIGFDRLRDGQYESVLEDSYALVINGLIKDLDIPVLVSAGNEFIFKERDEFTVPASLGEEACQDLIVVSGSLYDGKDDESMQDAGWVKIKAPSDNVDLIGGRNLQPITVHGTSASAAMTAGLVAYFATLNGKGGADARKTLFDKAFVRDKDQKPVLSNVGPKAGPAVAAPPAPALPTTAPPAPPAPANPAPLAQDMCGTWYRFLYDEFQIRGKDFDADKLGPGGSNLHTHLSHCGKVSDFKFVNTNNDPQGYQWLATGRLPIGTKSCVGSAVKDLGGNTADGCTGAG